MEALLSEVTSVISCSVLMGTHTPISEEANGLVWNSSLAYVLRDCPAFGVLNSTIENNFVSTL